MRISKQEMAKLRRLRFMLACECLFDSEKKNQQTPNPKPDPDRNAPS